jgi:hypothetical protein
MRTGAVAIRMIPAHAFFEPIEDLLCVPLSGGPNMLFTDPLVHRVARRYLAALSQDVPTHDANAVLDEGTDSAAGRVAVEYQWRRDGLERVDDEEEVERDAFVFPSPRSV